MKSKKAKNQNKSDLNVYFITPDGRWDWIVVIAASISILVTVQVWLQFGGIKMFEVRNSVNSKAFDEYYGFREQTISKTQIIAASCTGLLNGGIFRRFTYRQISLTGAILTSLGLALSVFVTDLTLLILLSLIFGIGSSLLFSASYIIVCTYFKKNIQIAMICMSSIPDLGSIFLPHLTSFLIDEGFCALLFYIGLCLHSFPCALVYQPVKLPSKKKQDMELAEIQPLTLVFGSRHIAKLNSLEENSTNSSSNDLNNFFNFPTKSAYPLRVPKNSFASFEPLSRSIPKIILPDETEYIESPQDIAIQQPKPDEEIKKPTILKRISAFFDLDLLMDISFLNIIVGLTLIYFVEFSFNQLIPIILTNHECWRESERIPFYYIILTLDFLMRISIPLVTRNLRCSNKVILVFGLIGMCIGRAIILLSNNCFVVIICIGWIGLCSGIRSVFLMLILPSYIPLNRLPAALGFQKAVTDLLLMFSLEQLLGTPLQALSYTNLHWINGIYLLVLLAWVKAEFLKQKTIQTIRSCF